MDWKAILINEVKRVFDIFTSFFLIIILSIPLIIITLLVFLDIKGNPIFTQYRNGKNLKKFKIYKFRTMTVSEDGVSAFIQAKKGDSRITKLGKILRRTSIDELLQIFNVFYGSMSLVGPRPHPVALDEEFKSKIPNYLERYNVKPGITGLAQINGFRGETETDEKMQNRIDSDLKYIKKKSFAFDFLIILKTFKVIFKGS